VKLKLESIRSAFALVASVPAITAVDSSAFVRLEHGAGHFTLDLCGVLWGHASIKTGDTQKWEFFVDRRVLSAFLSTAKGQDVDIICKGTQLVMKAGQTLDIPSHDAVTGYQTWKPAKTFSMSGDWIAGLQTLVRYCPAMPGMEYVDAVNFQRGYGAIATDTMVIAAILDPKAAWTMLVPSSLASLIKQFDGAQLAAEKTGFGIVTELGSVYQPLDDNLNTYPVQKLKEVINGAAKSKVLAEMDVTELRGVLDDAAAFLMDTNESAVVSVEDGALTANVEVHGGKFQRSIKVTGKGAVKPSRWPVKQLAPWLAYLDGVDPESKVGYAREPDLRILLSKVGGRQNVLVFADS